MAKKIEIDDALLEQLQKLADKSGAPIEAYIEKTIIWALENRAELDPLFANYQPYTGTTPDDLAQNHDDYLYGDAP